jgi:tetratricopeptide (TPR) repeat protein
VAKRITRKTIKKPDEFISSVDSAVKFLKTNYQRIILIVLLIVVVIVLGYTTVYMMHIKERDAKLLLQEAETAYSAPVLPPGQDMSKVPPGTHYYFSEEERSKEVLDKTDALLKKYPSTKAAVEARMLKAQALWSEGKKEEAAKEYQEVADRHPNKLPGALAQISLAGIMEDRGDYDAAIAQYEKLLNLPSESLFKDYILSSLGACEERKDRPEEALKAYQRLVDEYPMSVYADGARARIDELKPLVMEKTAAEEAKPAEGKETGPSGTPAAESKGKEPAAPAVEKATPTPEED